MTPLPVHAPPVGMPFSVTAAKYLEEVQRDKSARLRESTYAQYETTFGCSETSLRIAPGDRRSQDRQWVP